MNKKLIVLLICSLFNVSLFGEGFSSNTLVGISIFGGDGSISIEKMQKIGGLWMLDMYRANQGLYAYSMSPEGQIVLSKIVKKESREQFIYWELVIEGGTKIYADYNQRFYCPNRGTWVRLIDFDLGKDYVYSLLKGPLRVLDHNRVNNSYYNIEAPIHRLSVEKYENYFVSKDWILVHNFVPLVVPLGWIIAAHGVDFLAKAALMVAAGYVAEKVSEKLIPLAQEALRGSPKVGETGTPVVPTIDTENKANRAPGPEGTPPPDDGGPDLAKVPPIIAAEEELRKNGGPAAKAVSNAASNVVNAAKNALTTISEKNVQHIFRNKEGHFVLDTPANRKILLDVVNDQKNLLGPNKYGTQWYGKILSDGKQVWAEVRDGVIRNGGINDVPKTYNPITGLSKQ